MGIELRRLREAEGLTLGSLATSLGWSDSKVSRIETGQVAATTQVVTRLLDVYQVTGEQRQELIRKAMKAQEKAWWQAYPDTPVVPLVGLEEEAADIRIYEAMVVPGLFQTMNYAETIISSDRPELSGEQVQRWAYLRVARHEFLFSRDDPPVVAAVIDEAVLRRPVGNPEVMRHQLHYLAKAATLPTVTLRILPFAAGVHPAMNGAFTVFSFKEAVDPDVVYLEHTTNDLYLEDAEEVERYTQAFDRLWNLALPPDNSIRLITALAKNRPDRQTQI